MIYRWECCKAPLLQNVMCNLTLYFVTGISNFDLLGAFGRQDWLANFYLILAYNIIFGAAATACLVQKFSASMRQAIYSKIKHAILGDTLESRPHSNVMSDSRYFDWRHLLSYMDTFIHKSNVVPHWVDKSIFVFLLICCSGRSCHSFYSIYYFCR